MVLGNGANHCDLIIKKPWVKQKRLLILKTRLWTKITPTTVLFSDLKI